RVAIGEMKQAHVAQLRDVVERLALGGQRARRCEGQSGGGRRGQRLEEIAAVHCSSSSSMTASMPAVAQEWSASPPGAPETPMPPTSDPAASMGTPPPIAMKRGVLRNPDITSPGRVRRSRSFVWVLNEAAVHALLVATSIV